MTEHKALLSRVEIYRDHDEQWRFRAVALNGETVAVSEAYHNRQDSVDEAVRLWPDADVHEDTSETPVKDL